MSKHVGLRSVILQTEVGVDSYWINIGLGSPTLRRSTIHPLDGEDVVLDLQIAAQFQLLPKDLVVSCQGVVGFSSSLPYNDLPVPSSTS